MSGAIHDERPAGSSRSAPGRGRIGGVALGLLLMALAPLAGAAASPVVLLHGLGRGAASMEPMARALREQGYAVCNVGYPSRRHAIERLARDFVAPAIERCFPGRTEPLAFVTHSMGGIVVRELAARGAVGDIGRVVMLAPPNHGSEVVDALGGLALFQALHGDAGAALGTGAQAAPQRLGAPAFEVGVLTGDRSLNPLLSRLIPGPDDGKVSVVSARLEGMRDYRVLPVSHTFIMRDAEAIRQTLAFLADGRFSEAPPPADPQRERGPRAPSPAMKVVIR